MAYADAVISSPSPEPGDKRANRGPVVSPSQVGEPERETSKHHRITPTPTPDPDPTPQNTHRCHPRQREEMTSQNGLALLLT